MVSVRDLTKGTYRTKPPVRGLIKDGLMAINTPCCKVNKVSESWIIVRDDHTLREFANNLLERWMAYAFSCIVT
jgi:hypothetical protein